MSDGPTWGSPLPPGDHTPAPTGSTWNSSVGDPPDWGSPPPLVEPLPGAAPGLPTWVVVIALVVLPPLGLVLVWTSSRWSPRLRAAVSAPLLVVLAAGTLAYTTGALTSDAVRAATDGPAALPAPAAVPTTPAPTSPPSPPGQPMVVRTPAGSEAMVALADLLMAAEATTDYDRAAFGSPWTDTNRNGCDTRNDILGRDLSDVAFRPGSNDCSVLTGTLVDPYTGRTIRFQRGDSQVEVDHVVALADAWRSGAHTWSYAKLVAFANDPIELMAVGAAINQAKSDSDASEWLPEVGRCAFAARQVAVKKKYDLSVTPAERLTLQQVLRACPGEALPRGGNPTLAPNRQPRSAESPSP